MTSPYSEDLEKNISQIIAAGDHITPLRTSGYNCTSYLNQIAALANEKPQTALAFGMHLYTLWALSIRRPALVEAHLENLTNNNWLMCSLNDSGTYFKAPERLDYDRFPIKAVREDDCYVLSGKKPFSSMSTYVNYIPVTALERVNGTHHLVTLFATRDNDTVVIEDDWTSVSMPDTETNSISFKETKVPLSDVIFDPRSNEEIHEVLDLDLFLYRFHICVTYYAIATATLNHIVSDLNGNGVAPNPIRRFPYQQYKLSEIVIAERTLHASIKYLSDCLDGYMSGQVSYAEADINTLIFKEKITSTSAQVVETAMEITGIRSLSSKSRLSSLFQNVRAGRFHPPQPASALELIAKKKLNIDPRNEVRWG